MRLNEAIKEVENLEGARTIKLVLDENEEYVDTWNSRKEFYDPFEGFYGEDGGVDDALVTLFIVDNNHIYIEATF